MISRLIQYLFLATISLIVTFLGFFFAWLWAAFLDAEGNLPRYLRWFQPSDNLAIGDAPWLAEHPGYSMYWLAVTYMMRNPGQGFQQYCQAKITDDTKFRVYGNIDIKDGQGGIAGWCLITTENNYFHYTYIIDLHAGICLTGGFGWRLGSLVKGYQHPTRGQLVCTPFRFYKFTKA